MTPQTVDHQALLSMGFPRQEYWTRLPFVSSGDRPNPRTEPVNVAPWWVDSLLLSHQGSPFTELSSLKFICWSPNPCDGGRRWDLWEKRSWGWGPPDGISALIKRATRGLSPLLSLSVMFEHNAESSYLLARKRILTRSLLCWYLGLRLLTSRTVRKYISVV